MVLSQLSICIFALPFPGEGQMLKIALLALPIQAREFLGPVAIYKVAHAMLDRIPLLDCVLPPRSWLCTIPGATQVPVCCSAVAGWRHRRYKPDACGNRCLAYFLPVWLLVDQQTVRRQRAALWVLSAGSRRRCSGPV